uniref:Uncharacterized protein n=1 Tax=Timema cristinae TaxID=61476 RepID=A0A7R9CI37_TIMCR|nr:unnamed protein product [Timema cristinae]
MNQWRMGEHYFGGFSFDPPRCEVGPTFSHIDPFHRAADTAFTAHWLQINYGLFLLVMYPEQQARIQGTIAFFLRLFVAALLLGSATLYRNDYAKDAVTQHAAKVELYLNEDKTEYRLMSRVEQDQPAPTIPKRDELQIRGHIQIPRSVVYQT